MAGQVMPRFGSKRNQSMPVPGEIRAPRLEPLRGPRNIGTIGRAASVQNRSGGARALKPASRLVRGGIDVGDAAVRPEFGVGPHNMVIGLAGGEPPRMRGGSNRALATTLRKHGVPQARGTGLTASPAIHKLARASKTIGTPSPGRRKAKMV